MVSLTMDVNPKFYDSSNISDLNWGKYIHGDYYQRLFSGMLKEGSSAYINNIDHTVKILTIENCLYPIVIGNRKKILAKSYVASLYSQYVSYGKREIELEFKSPFLRRLGKGLLAFIARLFAFSTLDEVVFVNNWLLSTNLYPKEIPTHHLQILSAFLKEYYPHKAICFRSLNPFLNQKLINELEDLGYQSVFSRKVFINRTEQPRAHRNKRNFKHDLKLWKKLSQIYRWEKLENPTKVDLRCIRKLYGDLYIDKYAQLNPDFSLTFFEELIERKILNVHVLKDRDNIIAVVGYFLFEGVQTASVIGYDRTYPKEHGLYRLISLKIAELAEANKAILHASSGVSAFKASRGLQAHWEYNLIDWSGVAGRKKISWKALKYLANDITVPLMKKMDI
ncbi:MAG: hypothetical protein AAF696_25095 [Bacteroidota bacterium]